MKEIPEIPDSHPVASRIRYHAQAAWRPDGEHVPTVANSPTFSNRVDLDRWIVTIRTRHQHEADFTLDATEIRPTGKVSLMADEDA